MRCILSHDNADGIGKNNTLPWNIPADLKRFRELTDNSTMVMGSKTFFSLPINKRPLPGKDRRSIVLTFDPNNPKFDAFRKNKNLFICTLNEFKDRYTTSERNDMFVIGGSEIIRQCKSWIQEIHITHVFGNYQCDTFVRLNDLASKWEMTQHEKYKDHGYTVYNLKHT